ncbi:hypothetical protein RI129_005336 [Pyrocoelia pectoralis]|uniref:Inosine/uridine-preferring nucleoside hydrolase domain-containing protein n=1 Tax=Pyrocoelia pectoralis TaxID=417401 RepID=A0AAN7VFH6_9COLE
MECKRIVIDTDPGVDDAHAILILLDADKLNLVKIEAIIVTKGNTTVENGSKHVVRLLQMKNRTDIPVYRGVQYALLSNEEGASTYFGNDGMADLDYDEEPDLTFISVKPAPLALLELVEQNPNEITLVCLAPLTNVALAAGLSENFFQKVKEVFIMGGNWRAQGNETECAEFNFQYDPEAAYMVLQKLKCPTTVLANETCLDAAIDVNWRFDTLVNDSIDLTFMTMVERKFLSITRGDKGTWVPFDVFMVILILYPDVVVRAFEYHVTVELHGYFTRGQMVLDHLRKRKPNVTVVQEINRDYIMQILLNWYQIDK